MKTKKLYEIRVFTGNRYSRPLSSKLRERTRATKLKNYLKKRYGMEVFTNGMNIIKAA